ncbi:histone protein [Streptomyces endophytica]|uniref:Histone protein n=1 Tax=Streptomyces endophytica TaxID=2991496 RepID=A0ABY6PGC8_9ACTN|nr:histone protein [Streptomyces endophytica]UZJ32480.1 histone protein [Streptomyces endophytica]
MNERTKIMLAAAMAGGYVLGRTKKGRLALTAASYLAGRQSGLDPRQLVSDSVRRLGEIPQVAELGDQLRGEVMGAGRKALAAATTRQLTSLAETLQDRTRRLQLGPEEYEDEEEEEYEEEPSDEEEEEEEPEEGEEEGEYEDEEEEPEEEEEEEEERPRGGARAERAPAKKSPPKRAPAKKTAAKKAAKKAPAKKAAAKKAPAGKKTAKAAKKAPAKKSAAKKTASRGRGGR